jgi:hypothetical protein
MRIESRTALSLLAIVASLVMVAMVPASATAAAGLAFDPVLSLTGNCSVSSLDTVPDPGCPGGTHPPNEFTAPTSVTTDPSGDIFVASYGTAEANGAQGRIDVFAPDGTFITEVTDEFGPRTMAVDSKGNLYVFEGSSGGPKRIRRFSPSLYEPATGEIAYGKPPVVVWDEFFGAFKVGLAVNRANDHLFANVGHNEAQGFEFGSAEEENKLLDESVAEGLNRSGEVGIAVDAKHGLLYMSSQNADEAQPYVVRVFELSAPHNLLRTCDGSALPLKKYPFEPSIAVDEETGDFFTYFEGSKAVYRFSSSCALLGSVEYEFKYVFPSSIGFDSSPTSPNQGYLFVPSHPSKTGHSFAFGPFTEFAPEILAVGFDNVSENEAELRATINPNNAPTSYTFEYTSQQSFEAEGFAGAQVAGQGQLQPAQTGVDVAAPALGLSPQTTYRFRVVASNALGSDTEEGTFTTYPSDVFGSCSNDATRIGLSALLPDCRAYELVSPPDTNAHILRAIQYPGNAFTTSEVSPAGDKLSFVSEGGVIPGYEGTGSLNGDPYLATRDSEGWHTAAVGPTGLEAQNLDPGSTSPDQGYSFWSTLQGESFVRYPDGHSALIGRGALATDPFATGKLISENGSHIIFATGESGRGVQAIRLEEDAPPTGTQAIYDRTADEVTHVVSLLPGNKKQNAGEDASYDGASLDGRGVAFTIGTTLYLRRDNAATYEVAKEAEFAGFAEGGGRVFYVKDGNLRAFDVAAGTTIPFSTSGNVDPVNVAAAGTAAYFVSPSVLTTKANPNGEKAKVGEENLYLSREGTISFVGRLTKDDVKIEGLAKGLGNWTELVGTSLGAPGRLGWDPSRTTPGGEVLLFESRANLDGYDPEGHVEVYRYDASGPTLDCLSCNPTGAPASGEASLQSNAVNNRDPEALGPWTYVANLRADGQRAFFESTEPLVAADTDGLQDVYEWEAQGVGSCARAAGCVYLISSGQSERIDYLYAVSPSGDDVFFRTSDLLLSSDVEETPSIYDAKVGGGFPEEPMSEPCQGEGCRPGLSLAPVLPSSHTPILGKGDNLSRRCPKGKRKVKRHGKVRCVKKHRQHKHRHHRRAGTNKKGGSK